VGRKKRDNEQQRNAVDRLRHEFAEDLGLPGNVSDEQMINRFTEQHGENLQGHFPSDQARRVTPSFKDHKRDRQKINRQER